jgi:hypothetical protein
MIHSLLLLPRRSSLLAVRSITTTTPTTTMHSRYSNKRASRLTFTTALLLLSSQRACCAFSSPSTSFFVGRSAAHIRAGASLRSVSTNDISTQKENPSTMTTSLKSNAAGPKLDALRQAMDDLELDVYLVPSDDPHLSEYTPTAYMRRAFMTDFYGSAGTAVVTRDEALLWTDARYVRMVL